MHLESALPAGADPGQRARFLQELREAVLSGGRTPHAPRPLIAESWNRVLRMGVDPEHGREAPIAPREDVERRRRESPLIPVLDVLRDGLTSIAEDGVHIMVITDADGRLLWREGSTAVRSHAESLGFVEGALWDEATVGTNGIGTGLAVQRPVQIFAAEHFVRSHHPWICSAAPIHDPTNGRLLGLVDVSGPAATAHPSTLALVDAVTRLARRSLREEHGAMLAQLRAVAAPVLARVGGPAFVVDQDGWVAAAEGVWPGERVLLPQVLHEGDTQIPAVGPCRVEPLFSGWLIRVDPREPDRPTAVCLDLRNDAPLITVVAPSGSWQHRLSPRHAQILLLLASRPDGCSAAELSADLFGDSTHTVAVRAEVSRLRRRLGGILDHRPYRFRPSLDVRCELPDAAAGPPWASAAVARIVESRDRARP
ncbi:MAG TPA: GAF domain-containing protein [Streptosporangiaceae bacterium]